MSQIEMNTLLRATAAPEVRLPDAHSSRAVNRSFYIVVACVMAIGTTPFLIGWAAAGLLK